MQTLYLETTESYYSTEIGLLVAKRFVYGRGRKCRYNSLHKFRPFGSFLHFNSIEEQKHGPSYWKFNATLLDDSDFVRPITETVSVWLEEFTEVDDKRVLWDLIKYRIRQVTIKYSKDKANARREKLKIVEDSLKQCEDDCSRNPSPDNVEKLENLKLSTNHSMSTCQRER